MVASRPTPEPARHTPHKRHIVPGKVAPSVDRGNDHIAENYKRHRRRHHKERNILETRYSSRCRSTSPISSCVPNALDMVGNSEAEMAMPNKLTGSEFKVCA